MNIYLLEFSSIKSLNHLGIIFFEKKIFSNKKIKNFQKILVTFDFNKMRLKAIKDVLKESKVFPTERPQPTQYDKLHCRSYTR